VLPVLAQAATKERMAFTVESDTDNRDEEEELHERYRYGKHGSLRTD